MKFKEFTITKREVLVAIAITFLLLTLGFVIAASISNWIEEKNEKYYKALKINNDENEFNYAINTNIGYVLAFGKVETDGIEIKDIEGKYLYISKVKEEYTMHTREVPHTITTGKTTTTYYTTETYYTWDYVGEEDFHIDKFKYLGKEFDYGTINFSNMQQYKQTIQIDSNTRYKYYIIPTEFEGSLFTYIKDNNITENDFKENTSIDTIIQEKQKEEKKAEILFWIIYIIIIIIIDFGYMYLDNDYLEDNIEGEKND